MFSGSFKMHKTHIYSDGKVALMKAAAIYGANGSGKSNFIKAVHFLHDLVTKGNVFKSEVKCTPFRLNDAYNEKPSEFGLECQIGDRFFEYTVFVLKDVIIEENLYETFPWKGDATVVFSRKTKGEKTKIEVNPKLIKSEKDRYRFEIYAEDLQPNQPLIYKIRDKMDEAKAIFKWFKENLWILYPSSKYLLTARLSFDESYKKFLNTLLPQLGTGMQAIDIESIPFPAFFGADDEEDRVSFEEKLQKSDSAIHFFRKGKEYVAHRNGNEFVVNKVRTFNSDAGGNMVEFEQEEQSDGTRRLMDLIPAIQKLTDSASVFFIDEVDRSLHPSMIKELLRYFMESPSKGQLIFTTHESNLLDLDIFRQDEIWLSEKNDEGSSKMYPLSDFKPRYDLDIRKGYLAGRFGAIPFLGNLRDLKWKHAEKQGV
jgi:uncharacterized protein